MVADLHHFDEEQDPDPGQNQSRIWIRIKVKTGSAHINVMRIRNPANVGERKGKNFKIYIGNTLLNAVFEIHKTSSTLPLSSTVKYKMALYSRLSVVRLSTDRDVIFS